MMPPSTRVFAILSLSAAVGERIKRKGETENIRGAGHAMELISFESAREYPYPKLQAKKVNEIGEAVERLLSTPMIPQEILSMLIAGLVDIHAKCNPARHELLDPVIVCARACIDLYPGEIDHEAAFKRYERWVS